jgi:hypothetical protein
MIEGIERLSASDWETIRGQAEIQGVGGEHWEAAWLAAAAGHRAAIAAQSRALACEAPALAAAALAGAIAAIEVRGRLTAEHQAILTAPIGKIGGLLAEGSLLIEALAAVTAA